MDQEEEKEKGIIFTLVERFRKQRLPRALDIKKRVDAGELLTDEELHFLEEVNKEARSSEPLIDRHPEWLELYTKAVHLHKEIIEKALENEKARKS